MSAKRRHRKLRTLAASLFGVAAHAVGKTCRVHRHRDLRNVLRRDDGPYLLASLHAHQIGAAICGDPDICAMVSRSGDGAMVVPMLRRFGIDVVRGSGGKRRKGGSTALTEMLRRIRSGSSALLTVDGPGGPAGHVHRGVALLAKKTGRPVMAVVVKPERRIVLSKTWDRMQIPLPLTKIRVYFSRPLIYADGQSLESFANEIEREIQKMMGWYDPAEAVHLASDSVSTDNDGQTVHDRSPIELPTQPSSQPISQPAKRQAA